jgi:P-type Cu+ transporter
VPDVTGFHAHAGRGVTGEVGGRRVVLGNPALLREQGIDPGSFEQPAHEQRGAGRTVVFVAIDGRAAGLIAVADPVKATTRDALAELERAGLTILMATGDARPTADAVAREVQLKTVHAGLLPADKAELVEDLRKEGRRVAFAGDGINDAPALAAADVGIAMGSGSDIALQSAAITLVQGDLRGIARALALSRATMRNVRQNLAFAFVYNALGVPIAAGVLYPCCIRSPASCCRP